MEGMINTKLLKILILAALDDMQAHIVLIFNKYAGDVLKQAMS